MPSATRRRMLVLAAGGATASLSGCLGPRTCIAWSDLDVKIERGLALREPTDAEVVEATDRTPGDLNPLTRSLVRAAAESNPATYRGARREPSLSERSLGTRYTPRNSFVRVDDTYYRIVVETVAEADTAGYVLRVTTDATINAQAQSGDPLAFEGLPTHDARTILAKLGDEAGESQDEAGEFQHLWTIGYLEEATVESSLLAPRPEREYLRYSDYFIHLERFDEKEMTLRNYEVGLDSVGTESGTVAAAIRSADGTVLDEDDLTTQQREVVEAAAGNTYDECGDYSEALQELRTVVGSARYVQYDGTWYAVEWLP